MITVKRVTTAIERIRMISPIVGGPFNAARVVARTRNDPYALHSGNYKSIPFQFRGCDEQALREVLCDQEYYELASYLKSIHAPLVLDIGAHIGAFGLWTLEINPFARIVSVEADGDTFSVLRRNVTGVAASAQWQALHGAAAGQEGVELYVDGSGPSMSHRVSRDVVQDLEGNSGTNRVSSISLETLLDKLTNGPVDCVKVDIEGSEESFICDSPAALRRIRALVVEIHPKLCNADNVITALFKEFDEIDHIGRQHSNKPLLMCRRSEERDLE